MQQDPTNPNDQWVPPADAVLVEDTDTWTPPADAVLVEAPTDPEKKSPIGSPSQGGSQGLQDGPRLPSGGIQVPDSPLAGLGGVDTTPADQFLNSAKGFIGQGLQEKLDIEKADVESGLYVIDGKPVSRNIFKSRMRDREFVRGLQNGRHRIDLKDGSDEEIQKFTARQVQAQGEYDEWKSLNAGLLDLQASIVNAPVYLNDVMEEATGIPNVLFTTLMSVGPEARELATSGKAKEYLEIFAETLHKRANKLRDSKFIIDKENEQRDFIDLIDKEEYMEAGRMGINVLLDSAPIMISAAAASAVTGNPVGGAAFLMPLMASRSQVETRLSEEDAIRNLSDSQKLFRANMQGIAEGLPEAMMGPIINRSFKLFKQGAREIVQKVIAEKGEEAGRKVATEMAKETAGKIIKNYAGGTALEGVSEGTTTMINELTDVYLEVSDKTFPEIMRTTANDAAIGVFIGSATQGPGAAASLTVKSIEASKKFSDNYLAFDPSALSDLNAAVDAMRMSEKEKEAIKENIAKREKAIKAVPKDKVSDTETVDKVQKKQELQEEMSGLDPVYQEPIKEEIAKIDEELKQGIRKEYPAPTVNTSPTETKYATVNRNDGQGPVDLTQEEYLAEMERRGTPVEEAAAEEAAAEVPMEEPMPSMPDQLPGTKLTQEGDYDLEDPYTYQELKAEKLIGKSKEVNGISDWDSNSNLVRLRIENAGDILRELALRGTSADRNYLYEKINNLREYFGKLIGRDLHVDDRPFGAMNSNENLFRELRKVWYNQPTANDAEAAVRRLVLELANGNGDGESLNRTLDNVVAEIEKFIPDREPQANKQASATPATQPVTEPVSESESNKAQKQEAAREGHAEEDQTLNEENFFDDLPDPDFIAGRAAQKKEAKSPRNQARARAAAYNNMGKRERKGLLGNQVMAEIQQIAKENGFQVRIKKGGGIVILDENGKEIRRKFTRRTKEEVEAGKQQTAEEKAYRRDVLGANPVSPEHLAAILVASGARFNKKGLVDAGDANVGYPRWMVSNDPKKGFSIEMLYEHTEQMAFNTDAVQWQNEHMEQFISALNSFAIEETGKQEAFEEAERIYQTLANGADVHGEGMTDQDIRERAAYLGYTATPQDVAEAGELNRLTDEEIAELLSDTDRINQYENSQQFIQDAERYAEKSLQESVEPEQGEVDADLLRAQEEGASPKELAQRKADADKRIADAKADIANMLNRQGVAFDPENNAEQARQLEKKLVELAKAFIDRGMLTAEEFMEAALEAFAKYGDKVTDYIKKNGPRIFEAAKPAEKQAPKEPTTGKDVKEAVKKARAEERKKASEKMKALRESLEGKFKKYRQELKDKTRKEADIIKSAQIDMRKDVRDAGINFNNVQASKLGRLISEVNPNNYEEKTTELKGYVDKLVSSHNAKEAIEEAKRIEKEQAAERKAADEQKKELLKEVSDALNIKKYGRKTQRTRKRKKVTITNQAVEKLRAISELYAGKLGSMSIEELTSLDAIIDDIVESGKIERKAADAMMKARRERLRGTGLEMVQRKADMTFPIEGRQAVMDQISPAMGTEGGGNLVKLKDGTFLNPTVEGRKLAETLPDEAFEGATLIIVPVQGMTQRQSDGFLKGVSDIFKRGIGAMRSRMDVPRLLQALAQTKEDAQWLHENYVLSNMMSDEKVFSDRKMLRKKDADLKKSIFGSESKAETALNKRTGIDLETTDQGVRYENLTADEAIYIYNQVKQASSIDKMINAKMTVESILKVIAHVNSDPKLKSYANGIIGIFDSYLPTANEALEAGGYIGIAKVSNKEAKEGLLSMAGDPGAAAIRTAEENLEQAKVNLANNEDPGMEPRLERAIEKAEKELSSATKMVDAFNMKKVLVEAVYGSIEAMPEFEEYSPRSVAGTDLSVQGPNEFFSTSVYDSKTAPSIVSGNLVERQTGGTLKLESSQDMMMKYIDSMPVSAHKMQDFEAAWALFHNSSPVLTAAEKIYGEPFRAALQMMVFDTVTGKPSQLANLSDKVGSDTMLKWLLYASSDIMFLNWRSAIFQTISASNFIVDAFTEYNLGPEYIGKMFEKDTYTEARQEIFESGQFYHRVKYSSNPDIRDMIQMRKTRGAGAAAKWYVDKIRKIYEKGYAPTQFADSNITIAYAGSPLYAALKDRYIQEGLDKGLDESTATEKGKEKAMAEFWVNANKTQQSSLNMFRSVEQSSRSPLVRMLFTFGSVSLLMTRAMFEAASDVKNGRISLLSGASRIAYYGAIQNLMFYTMQSGILWLFGEDDDEERKKALRDKKTVGMINDSVNNVLRGLGAYGAVLAFAKDFALSEGLRSMKKSDRESFERDLKALEGLTASGSVRDNLGRRMVKMAPSLDVRVRDIERSLAAIRNDRTGDARGEAEKLWMMMDAPIQVVSATGLTPGARMMGRIIDGVMDASYEQLPVAESAGRIVGILGKYEMEARQPLKDPAQRALQKSRKEAEAAKTADTEALQGVLSEKNKGEFVNEKSVLGAIGKEASKEYIRKHGGEVQPLLGKLAKAHNIATLSEKDKELAKIVVTTDGDGKGFVDAEMAAARYFDKVSKTGISKKHLELIQSANSAEYRRKFEQYYLSTQKQTPKSK